MLTFSKTAILRLVEDTLAAKDHRVPYTGEDWGEPEDHTPGLLLVGDQGVYFMSNRVGDDNHIDSSKGGSPENAVYANECNPDTCADWFDIKASTFGGDDGVEFFPLAGFINDILSGPGTLIGVEFGENKVSFYSLQ